MRRFLLSLGLVVIQAVPVAGQANGKLQLHFMNVGQGDGAVLISPLGEVVLFDGGPKGQCGGALGYLQTLGVSKFEAVVVSHYDADHIECIPTVLASIPLAGPAYDRGGAYDTQAYAAYVNSVGGRRSAVSVGQRITLDAASLHPVYIDIVAVNTRPTSTDDANGVVAVVRYGEFEAVFGGDLPGNGPDVEAEVASRVGPVEVYKVHHHGSAGSSNELWMAVLRPRVAVLSVGTSNSYGHPTAEALDRIHAVGTRAYWTSAGNGAAPTPFLDVVGGDIAVEVGPQTTYFTVTHSAGVVDTLLLTPVALSGKVVINEFRTRGPRGGYDEFVELRNVSSGPVSLSGWRLMESSESGVTDTRVTLGNVTLGPGCTYLLANSRQGEGYSGAASADSAYSEGIPDNGGIALLDVRNNIVDAVGMSSGAAYKEGTPLAAFGSTNSDRSFARGAAGADTDDNSSDFAMTSPASPSNLASCTTFSAPPAGTGSASPGSVSPGSSSLLTVTVAPGTNPPSTDVRVVADLSLVGGSTVQSLSDGGTAGDGVAGDGVFSFMAPVVSTTSAGPVLIPATVTDAQGRSVGVPILLDILGLVPTNPSAVGNATPAIVTAGGTTLLSVAVTPGDNPTSSGLSVTADLSAVGGLALQPFFDDGSLGDATGGDGVFSLSFTVPASAVPGAKTVAVHVADAQGRSAATLIQFAVGAPVVHALTITGAGTGAGTISSQPALLPAINCSLNAAVTTGSCLKAYQEEATVTLTAAAADGSTFAGWSGACSGLAPCTVTMAEARTVTAQFALSSGAGVLTLTAVKLYSDHSGNQVVVGEVRNDTSDTLVFGSVTFAFLKQDGALLGTAFTYVHGPANRRLSTGSYVTTVPPGESAFFKLWTSIPASSVDSLGFVCEATVLTTSAPLSSVTIDGPVVLSPSWSGGTEATGAVLNSGPTTAYFVEVHLAGYTADGIDDVTFTYVDGQSQVVPCLTTANDTFVLPGTSTPFTVSFIRPQTSVGRTSLEWREVGVSPASAVHGAAGGSGSFTSIRGCGWVATSTADWITITSGATRSSSTPGTIVYAVAPNLLPSPRVGTIDVSGTLFTITQDPAPPVLFHGLTVAGVGSGAGAIASAPGLTPAVACTSTAGTLSGTCSASYEQGTVVTLTATPAVGSTFAGWTGGCSSTGTCTVAMTQVQAVTAAFALQTFVVTLSGTGTGQGVVSSQAGLTPAIVCDVASGNASGACAQSYAYGTIVTLTAAPIAGSTFAGWSGACSGTDPCVVTVTQAQSVAATFAKQAYALALTGTGDGTGTVASAPGLTPALACTSTAEALSDTCSVSYGHGTVVTLTATPAVGSTFTGWTGACTGTGACAVTMTQAQSVTATFRRQTFTVSAAGAGTGQGAVSSQAGLTPAIACGIANGTASGTCAQSYPYGTSVTLTAVSTTGSVFSGWSGACSGTDPCVVTVTQAQNVTATFTVQPTGPDGDGLPDDWETRFGLSTTSGTGDDGPTGDPDKDGVNNLDELRAGTHPRGFHTKYFAEGATGDFFDVQLALVNPDDTDVARVLLGFQKPDGTRITYDLPISPRERRTVSPEALPGLGNTAFSTVIESDVLVVADRTMTWGGGYGSHAETSVPGAATRWYLAEGATHSGFQLFYLLQNPSKLPANVQIEFLLPAPRAPVVKTYLVAPGSRSNVWVNAEPELAGVDVSATITSDQPIIVERAMYMNRGDQLFAAGHESAGLTEPATRWFLAEGATGEFFDLFVLIANPNEKAAAITARFLLPDGSVIEQTYSIAAKSRFNIWVDAQGGRLADTAVSTTITSTNGVPILVERAMWWPGSDWTEAHNSPGTTSTGTLWALAEGECGPGMDTYVLVANTSPHAGTIKVTLLVEGATTAPSRTFLVEPTSRFNIVPPVHFPDVCTPGTTRRFGMLVESLAGAEHEAAALVVERAMYSDAGGVGWAAGTNALATRLR